MTLGRIVMEMKKKMGNMVKGSKMKNMHNMLGKIIIKEEIIIMMRRSIRRVMVKNKNKKMERIEDKVRMKMKEKTLKRFQMLNKLCKKNSKGRKKRIRMILMIRKK